MRSFRALGRAIALSVAALGGLAPAIAQARPLSIDEVVDKARRRAPEAVDAAGGVRVAEAARVGARVPPLLNPWLEVTAERSRVTQDVAIQSSLGLPIEIGGQRARRLDEAERLAAWRRGVAAEAEARAIGEAVLAYGDLAVATARVIEARRGEAEARAEAELQAARVDAGDATRLDRSLAESEVARWAQIAAEAELARLDAKGRLEPLLGEPVDVDDAPIATWPPALRGGAIDRAPARLVDRAPAVVALGAEGRFWSSARARHEAERTPPLGVIVTAGRGDFAEARVGGGLSWSLPVVRRNQGEIARADAEAARVAATEASARRAIAARLEAAYARYRTAFDAARAAEEAALPAAERAVQAATEGQRAGKTELLRVLITRRDRAAARARHLDLLGAAWRSYGEIVALRGELP